MDARREKTSISCRWRTRATRCITANVLQTKVDVQCDKLATELSWQRLQRSTFPSYSELFVESRQFLRTPPAFGASVGGDPIWVLPRSSAPENHRAIVLGYRAALFAWSLAVSVQHRFVTDRQTDRQTQEYGIYRATAWRRVVKMGHARISEMNMSNAARSSNSCSYLAHFFSSVFCRKTT